jgi:transcriptional regulator with XRE-family HTH domain
MKYEGFCPIGTALENLRISRKLPRYYFADALGIHASHYSEMLHRKREWSMKAIKSAYTMGIDAEILLGEKKPRNSGMRCKNTTLNLPES